MKKRPFTPCKLFYDAPQTVEIEVGDFLVTGALSCYLVQKAHRNRNKPQRWQLDCVRWPYEDLADDATCHPLVWYSRDRKRSTVGMIGLPAPSFR
jgi:hypothetical protein